MSLSSYKWGGGGGGAGLANSDLHPATYRYWPGSEWTECLGQCEALESFISIVSPRICSTFNKEKREKKFLILKMSFIEH